MYFADLINVSLSQNGLYIAGTFSNIFGYALLAFLLLFLHGKVTVISKQQRRRVEGTSGSQERKYGVDRATKIMVIVVGVYLLLWAPFTASSIASLILQRSNAIIEFIQNYGLVLGTYNSSVNFIIYTAFKTENYVWPFEN